MSLEPQPETHTPVPAFPMFEGHYVDASALKVANSSVLDLTDVVLAMDDVIQIVVEAKVTGVNHIVDDRSGRMIRVHTVKAFDARLQPFNPNYDDGVDRSDQ